MRALLVALAACSSSPGPAQVVPPAAPPTIEWDGSQVTTERLPAVSADGTTIVYAHERTGGGRGGHVPRLVLAGRDDRERDSTQLATIDEVVDGTLGPADAKQRAEAARAWLAAHAPRVTPMTVLAVQRPDDGSQAHEATGDGFAIDWTPSHLAIRHGAEVLLDRATPPGWLVGPHKLCDSCEETCENPAHLAAAAIDLAHRVALVTLAFQGSDTCWEPDAATHVVAW
ncbi:MAG TPA: hypothetical protein VGM88_00050 [Kofleriaceae bacterium]|jgi:hypothetical protein